jgi:hypothetical protein
MKYSAKFYIFLKKYLVNNIAFINDVEEGQKVKSQMEKGYRTIRNDLEKAMMSDINLLYEEKKLRLSKCSSKIDRIKRSKE